METNLVCNDEEEIGKVKELVITSSEREESRQAKKLKERPTPYTVVISLIIMITKIPI